MILAAVKGLKVEFNDDDLQAVNKFNFEHQGALGKEWNFYYNGYELGDIYVRIMKSSKDGWAYSPAVGLWKRDLGLCSLITSSKTILSLIWQDAISVDPVEFLVAFNKQRHNRYIGGNR